MRYFGRTATALIFAGLFTFLAVNSSWAIPNLQIYSPQGYYDADSETWIINSYTYELWVVGAHLDVSGVKFAMAVPADEEGSIVVRWLDPTVSDYVSQADMLMLDETDLVGTGGMSYEAYRSSYQSDYPDPSTYGFAENSIPLKGDGKKLPGGGVFPTDFYEYFIGDLGTDELVRNYLPGEEWGDTAAGEIKKFAISVSDYSWVDIVAYNHVVLNDNNNNLKYVKTPYSHDGSSGSTIPEPGTALLLGFGLVALGFVLRFPTCIRGTS